MFNSTWKDIKNYGGTYQVSIFGEVKNTKTGRVKKPTVTTGGYLRTQLSLKGVNKRFFIHRLVAETFLGHSALQVNHINSDKQDNKLINLEFVDACKNQAHRYRAKNKRRGVRKILNKYRAEIKLNRYSKSLGIFDNIEDAYKAYHTAYTSHYGVEPWTF